jgi:hypothetical protein
LEVWEKVFLKDAAFMEDTHGKVGCVICHGGDCRAEDKAAAHLDLTVDPSPTSCESCHAEISGHAESSLHVTLDGMRAKLEARGADMSQGSLADQAFENHCARCHTTCGQCHISRPTQSDGGLLKSHQIKKSPSMLNNCAACHGARAGNEYLGNNEGVPGDLHWSKLGMTCNACHGDELHAAAPGASDKYDNDLVVSCEDSGCHDTLRRNLSQNSFHDQHVGDLSCQVCHSVAYKNCYDCHTYLDDAGAPKFSTEPSVMLFKVGLNPLISEDRPYRYVVLRHVPGNPELFDYYGTDLLPEFENEPTWKYATPHNIQLKTPQTESCNACHGNAALFLTAKDIAPAETAANQKVVVNEIPAGFGGGK